MVNKFAYLCRPLDADVVKLVDTLDLGSSAARLGGSSPSIRTQSFKAVRKSSLFCFPHTFEKQVFPAFVSCLPVSGSIFLNRYESPRDNLYETRRQYP
jgi:hypothetical protein